MEPAFLTQPALFLLPAQAPHWSYPKINFNFSIKTERPIFKDPFHSFLFCETTGTASHYAKDFQSTFGRNASYVGAGATATFYSLASAIQSAFTLCSLTRPDAAITTDELLFNPNVLDCHVGKNQAFGTNTSNFAGNGYHLVRAVGVWWGLKVIRR